MDEKKSAGGRLTLILALVLAAFVLAVALPVVMDGLPDEESAQPGEESMKPVSPAMSQQQSARAARTAEAAGTSQPEPNSWCRSYVYSKCNAASLPARNCMGIARVGADVPRDAGVAACRAAVDELIQREIDRMQNEVDPVERAELGVAPVAITDQDGDAGEGVSGMSGGSPASNPDNRQSGQNPGPRPNVVFRKAPEPAEVEAGMSRIRQLQQEISVQRNTFVGTNIGVQSRLDEMREIAAKLETEEAAKEYNGTLEKLGHPGTLSRPPSQGGSPVEAAPSAPVEAAPSLF